MGQCYCPRKFVQFSVVLLLLTVVASSTVACSTVLGILGYSTSFQENAENEYLSFNTKLFNWFRFMMAAVTLFAFIESSTVWLLLFIAGKVEPILRRGISKVKKWSCPSEFQNDTLKENFENIEGEIGQSYAQKECRKGTTLQQPGAGVFVAIFISLFCGSISIACFVFAFMLKSKFVEKVEHTVVMFLVTDVFAGMVFPLLLLTSIFLLVSVMDYYTGYKLNSRWLLAKLLPAVKLSKKEDNKSYWIINETLELCVSHLDQGVESGRSNTQEERQTRCCCFGSIKNALPSYSTFLLAVFLILNLVFSFSYFIDISLVFQYTIKDSCAGIKHMWYTCFKSDTLALADCSFRNTTIQTFYCYRFHRDWLRLELTLAALSSLGLYVGVLYILVDIITIAGKLRRFCQHQGAFVVTGGTLLFLVTIITYVIWQIRVPWCVSRFLRSYLNILHFAQVAILSLNILIFGLLICNGTWIEANLEENQSITQDVNEIESICQNNSITQDEKEIGYISLNKFVTQDKMDLFVRNL